jgi:hypothetical protein
LERRVKENPPYEGAAFRAKGCYVVRRQNGLSHTEPAPYTRPHSDQIESATVIRSFPRKRESQLFSLRVDSRFPPAYASGNERLFRLDRNVLYASRAAHRREAYVAENERFQGFFSYTHLDAEIDPDLIEALTARLEKRVTRKLTNASFAIWRDTNNLRTGDRWDERIGDAVRASQVFIVLMTPKWFESAYCRKEYQIFQQVERGIAVGEYVVPLLAHAVEKQIKRFNREQKAAYEDLNRRQYKKTIAADFLALTKDQREGLIDEIADDIEGMIERLRGKPASPPRAGGATPSRRASRT